MNLPLPSLNKAEVKGGDILLPLRLITSSALLLDKRVRLDEGNFFDFCTLIKALTLHDRIITLPVEYIPDEILHTSLFTYLADEELKILNVLNWNLQDFTREAKEELERSIYRESSKRRISKYISDERCEYYLRNEDADIHTESQIGAIMEEYIHWHTFGGPDYTPLKRETFLNNIMNGFVQRSNDRINGAMTPPIDDRHEDLAFRLRTAFYWEVSETLNVPLMPDLTRIPIISHYHAGIQQSLRMHIQSRVDEFEQKKVINGMKIIGRWPVPIPSPVSHFLQLYCYKDLSPGEALENMRNDFDVIRRKMVAWEDKIRQVEDLGTDEALKAMENVSASIGSLEEKSVSTMIISMVPSIEAIAGAQGVNSFIDAIKKGSDLIQLLRKRRQMTYFNTLRTEAQNIVKQTDLLINAFDSSLTREQTARFLELCRYLSVLTNPRLDR